MFGELLAKVATAPAMTWLTLNVVAPLDLALLRSTGGRRSLTGPATVILVTKGARSGKIRETALPALHFEGEIILLASKGGNPKHPGWYHNLIAEPRVEVVHNGSTVAHRARVVEGEERERLWRWLVEQWDGFATYARRAAPRVLPIVALTAITEASPSDRDDDSQTGNNTDDRADDRAESRSDQITAAECAPSTGNTAPLTNEPASEASMMIGPMSSSTSPARRAGVRFK